MIKRYKIANINIEFDIPYRIVDFERYKKFETNELYSDYEVYINEKYECKENINRMVYNKNRKYYFYNNDIVKTAFLDNYKREDVYLYEFPNEKKKIISFPNIGNEFYISQIFAFCNIEGILLENNIAIFHSNYIIDNGNAILFTGISGAGKSTQGDLWVKYQNAEIINGDKSALSFKQDKLYAYGVPFCGSSTICKNRKAPVKAIILVNKDIKNEVIRLNSIEAFKILLGQIAVNRINDKEIDLAIALIEKIVKNVPVLKINCLPDKEATIVLKDYLNFI